MPAASDVEREVPPGADRSLAQLAERLAALCAREQKAARTLEITQRDVRRAMNALRKALGRDGTYSALAERTGINVGSVWKVLNTGVGTEGVRRAVMRALLEAVRDGEAAP